MELTRRRLRFGYPNRFSKSMMLVFNSKDIRIGQFGDVPKVGIAHVSNSIRRVPREPMGFLFQVQECLQSHASRRLKLL